MLTLPDRAKQVLLVAVAAGGASRLKARLTLLAVAASLTLAATAAPAFPGVERASGGCGNKLVFLVWPKGHPAIPRYAEFPEIPNPHVELYRGFNKGYDVAYAGAWVIGGKPPAGTTRGGFFTACANYGDHPVTKGTVANPRVITQETAVKCVFPVSPVTDVALRAGGVADLYVHSGGRLLAHAHVTKSSVRLIVPSGRCTLAAPPRP